MLNVHIKYRCSIVVTLLILSINGLAQTKDSTNKPQAFFAGTITATNNGISLIPSFSLGKPAVLFDLSIGKGRLSFDPMLRFNMNGKPWSFIFWWRYKLINDKKFKLGIGAHPSFVFREVKVVDTNRVARNYLNTQRYFAWEVAPTYFVSKHVSASIYYLGSHGLTKDITQYTHFVALKSTISNIYFRKQLGFTFIPQVYYLKMDKKDGFYANASLFLMRKNFPLNIGGIVSQAIDTRIAGKKFLWSVGLNYVFNKKFKRV